MMRRVSKVLLLITFSIAGAASASHAQEGEAVGPETTQSSEELAPRPSLIDEVIVSAQRRDQNLQDVAVAVSVYSSETRQVVGLDNMIDFAKHTPGLSYSSSDDRVFVRGIGRQTNTAGSEPGVAAYGDGAYDSSTVSINGSDFFVERVEVLRGPQGTLYGRNSIGGAINAISKRPKDEVAFDARAVAASYSAYSLSFLMSLPLSDQVRASFGGSYGAQEEGYFENVASGATSGSAVEGGLVEFQLEADVSDNLTTWFRLFTGAADLRPRGTNLVTPYDTAAMPSGYLTPGSALGYSQPSLVQLGTHKENPGVRDSFEVNANTENKADIGDYWAIMNHTTWSAKSFDIKLITSWRNYIYNSRADLDSTDVISYNYPILGTPACPAMHLRPA